MMADVKLIVMASLFSVISARSVYFEKLLNPRAETGNSCTENLQTPHEKKCNLYYRCVYGVSVTKECPDGALFNPRIANCDSSYNVDCGNLEKNDINEEYASHFPDDHGLEEIPIAEHAPNANTIAEPSECPEERDPVLLPHEELCNAYYRCSKGKKILLKCPNVFQFNPKISACDWPINVRCIDGMRSKSIERKTGIDSSSEESHHVRVIRSNGSESTTAGSAPSTEEMSKFDAGYDESKLTDGEAAILHMKLEIPLSDGIGRSENNEEAFRREEEERREDLAAETRRKRCADKSPGNKHCCDCNREKSRDETNTTTFTPSTTTPIATPPLPATSAVLATPADALRRRMDSETFVNPDHSVDISTATAPHPPATSPVVTTPPDSPRNQMDPRNFVNSTAAAPPSPPLAISAAAATSADILRHQFDPETFVDPDHSVDISTATAPPSATSAAAATPRDTLRHRIDPETFANPDHSKEISTAAAPSSPPLAISAAAATSADILRHQFDPETFVDPDHSEELSTATAPPSVTSAAAATPRDTLRHRMDSETSDDPEDSMEMSTAAATSTIPPDEVRYGVYEDDFLDSEDIERRKRSDVQETEVEDCCGCLERNRVDGNSSKLRGRMRGADGNSVVRSKRENCSHCKEISTKMDTHHEPELEPKLRIVSAPNEVIKMTAKYLRVADFEKGLDDDYSNDF